jgi:hypothetical protein
VSGSPGHGHGSSPEDPVEAVEAKIPAGSLWKTGPVQSQAVMKAMREKLFVPTKPEHKELGPTAEALVKFAMNFDVSSPHNGALFWSGGNAFAGKAADQLAAERTLAGQPSTRLEGTQNGSLLNNMSAAINQDKVKKPNGVPWSEQDPAWRVVSTRYALAASGDVTCVVGRVPVGEDAILREEVETLKSNPKVTSINFVAIKLGPDGKTAVNKDGKPLGPGEPFVLEPATAEDVLAPPKPAAAPAPGKTT